MAVIKYRQAVRVKNAWKDPSHSTKYPVPIVLIMAANVPAEFEIPVHKKRRITMYLLIPVRNVAQHRVVNGKEKNYYHGENRRIEERYPDKASRTNKR